VCDVFACLCVLFVRVYVCCVFVWLGVFCICDMCALVCVDFFVMCVSL